MVEHLLTVPLPCRKCHYSLIVQPHAVLPWRRANTTKFWFLPLCYNLYFFFFLCFIPVSSRRLHFYSFSLVFVHTLSRFLSNYGDRDWGRFASPLISPPEERSMCSIPDTQVQGYSQAPWYMVLDPTTPTKALCFVELEGEMSLATTIMTSLHMYHHLNRINE